MTCNDWLFICVVFEKRDEKCFQKKVGQSLDIVTCWDMLASIVTWFRTGWCSEMDWFKFAATYRTYTFITLYIYIVSWSWWHGACLKKDGFLWNWLSLRCVTSQWGYKLLTDANSRSSHTHWEVFIYLKKG